jgi:hypothetical protein
MQHKDDLGEGDVAAVRAISAAGEMKRLVWGRYDDAAPLSIANGRCDANTVRATAPSAIRAHIRERIVAEHVHVAYAVAGVAHAPAAALKLHVAVNREWCAFVRGGLDDVHAGHGVALRTAASHETNTLSARWRAQKPIYLLQQRRARRSYRFVER